MKPLNVAVVGATGLVGSQLLTVLKERDFPVGSLKLLASARSVGMKMEFRGRQLEVLEARPDAFEGTDIAFFCAGTDISRELAPYAVKAGAVVIDKSNAFRLDRDVPLVVPEVNPEALADHKGIVASPNCSTIQMVVALKPIHLLSRIERVIVSTYQAVTGTGKEAAEELREQSEAVLAGKKRPPVVYPYQIAFNLLPHIDSFWDNGFTGEEMKMVLETKKILRDDDIQVAATTVRVPVFNCHSESVSVKTVRPLGALRVRQALASAPGVIVADEPTLSIYPMPIDASGRDEVFVGRIRDDLDDPTWVHFWLVADNVRKGAATNAVQIAETMIQKGLL
ncbi:MAG: aspartate-semialdehyde dehydrogenase [Bacillota bacterium]